MEFIELTATPDLFFDILPSDWRSGLEPHWDEYKESSKIYGLFDEGELVCGGVVFSKVTEDTIFYEEIAEKWLKRGFLYIGYLYVVESRRGRGYGSRWLNELFKIDPGQSYWLSIEEYELKDFYLRNGFQLVEGVEMKFFEQIAGEIWKEWILVRDASQS
ncbi:MAG: hypothetical protein Kow0027_30410 [Saprospiraceae bacterium]|nr:hypothetical protein [Saprospirales bacterium]